MVPDCMYEELEEQMREAEADLLLAQNTILDLERQVARLEDRPTHCPSCDGDHL